MSNEIKFAHLLKKLNYSKKCLDDRLKIVYDIFGYNDDLGCWLQGEDWDKFYDDTLDGTTYKVNLNKDDMSCSDNELSKFLESVATYILNSDESKELDKKDNIKIYHSKEMFDRMLQEEKLREGLIAKKDDDKPLSIFVKQRNYKIVDDKGIKQKDIDKSKVLSDYNNALNKLQDKQRVLNKKKQIGYCEDTELKELYLLRKSISGLKDDMKLAYLSEYRPIQFKAPLRDEGSPEWDMLDIGDEEVIKILLSMNKEKDYSSDLDIILLDFELLLNNMIKNNKFEDIEIKIIKFYNKGYKYIEISRELGVSLITIKRKIGTIVSKIKKYIDKSYYNWYYLNISKGKYKKCIVCGRNNLIGNFVQVKSDFVNTCCEDCVEEAKKNPIFRLI